MASRVLGFGVNVRGWLAVLLLAWLGATHPARATHIVGGEMDLQHISGATYQITLNLYFDALNGNAAALDNDLTVSIFEKGSNRRMQNVAMPLTGNTLVNYTNPACSSPSLVTRRLVYTARLELPAGTYANAAGYYAAVERCCRNNGISNIQNAADAGQTFYLEFPPVVRGGQPLRNSTPRIFPPLSDYACLGELFYYDFGGQDADGDSLAYELATPLNGYSSPGTPKPAVAQPQPYAEVRWLGGLGVLNQIPGAPTLAIDGRTGRLQVRPTALGLFVFGIKCSEYRRGVKLGEVRRDFQLKVIGCPRNAAPSMLALVPGGRGPYRVGRDTLRLRPGTSRCVTLRFTDPDYPARLSLSLSPVNFSAAQLPSFSVSQGTVHQPGAPDTLVSQLCFPACFNTRGQVYLLDVIVADDGCSLPKRDTVRLAFISIPDPNAAPTLVSTAGPLLPLRARPGDVVTFDLTGADPDNDPVTLTMTGRGFDPAAVGATLTQTATGAQRRGRFSWRVDCRAVGRPLYEFEFRAAAGPCGEPQTTWVVVPVQIDYANTPPELASSLPPPGVPVDTPPLVRRPLGGVYEATFTGTDADADPLVLSATGNGFALADAGMSFRAQNGPGRATATFRWDASCAALRPAAAPDGTLEVMFQLQESTCRPEPRTRVVRFQLVNPDTVAFRPVNIFTPNNDGKNEFFAVDDLPPDFCDSRFADVKIFSRWGTLVYQSTNRNFRWGGGQQPAGVYYYLIEFTDGRKYKGPITLAR